MSGRTTSTWILAPTWGTPAWCAVVLVLVLVLMLGACVEPMVPGGGDRSRVRARGQAVASAQTRPATPAAPTRSASVGQSTRPAARVSSFDFSDGKSGISFRVPADMVVEARAFDPAGPVGQMRHRLVVMTGKLESLSVEVWDNPTSLDVDAWFDKHLAFVRDEQALVDRGTVSGHRVSGMLIRRPRSPQAFGQRMAIFTAAGRVVRVTCHNADDAATLAAFQRVVASITVGAGA